MCCANRTPLPCDYRAEAEQAAIPRQPATDHPFTARRLAQTQGGVSAAVEAAAGDAGGSSAVKAAVVEQQDGEVDIDPLSALAMLDPLSAMAGVSGAGGSAGAGSAAPKAVRVGAAAVACAAGALSAPRAR